MVWFIWGTKTPPTVSNRMTTTEPDDARLIEQSQQGDEAAFRQLVDKYWKRIYRVALGFLGDHQEAEEATQDAFLRASQKIKTFRGEAKFLTWLIAIVRNCCLNRRRGWARRKRVIVSSSEQAVETEEGEQVRVLDVPDPSPTPAQQAIYAEQQQQVQVALQQLDEFSRTVVTLRCEQGISFEDIAQIVNRPVGTVKSCFHRARLRLAELLEGKL